MYQFNHIQYDFVHNFCIGLFWDINAAMIFVYAIVGLHKCYSKFVILKLASQYENSSINQDIQIKRHSDIRTNWVIEDPQS